MKKKGICMLALALASMCFTGCGNQEEKDQITIKVWESLEVKDYIEAAGEAYHELHPEVNIVFENVESQNSTQQIILDGPAGAGADLFAAPCDKLGELVVGGYVKEVKDSEFISSTVLPSCLKAATYEDTVYGYPVSDETYALYYNKALISQEEVPKTWEDMIAYTKENTKNGNYGFVMDATNGYYTIIFATSNGNRLFGPDGRDTSATYLNNEDALKGFSVMSDLSKAVGISSSDINTEISDNLFATGKAAMVISGPWNTAVFEEAGIDYGVTTLPSLPDEEDPVSSFSGARLMLVSSYSEHPEEASDFAEFLLSEEMQQLRYEYLKCIPSVEVELEDEAIEGFMKQLAYATPMPSNTKMTFFWDSMSSASKSIWDGADVESTMDSCDEAILNSGTQ